ITFLFFYCSAHQRVLHSFPTRRSSDLDVTSELRSVRVNQIVAKVARAPGVREVLGALQRSLGSRGTVVMEGRDIGSVILPHAGVKVFLTASMDVRAQRRQMELAASGTPLPLEAVRRIIEEDDRMATT